MSRITIKDIARLLNLNVSTVSRALSDHPDVNPDTKNRVLETARTLGYIPNFLAVNLRRKHSGLIGLILSEMNMFFLPSVMRAVEEEARKNGYTLVILQSNNNIALETQNLQICQQLAVEGVLITLSAPTHDLKHFASIFEQEIPVVFFDKVPPEENCNKVAIDDALTAQNAVEYLFSKGHRRIYGVFGNPEMGITRMRLEGYRQAFRARGLEPDENLIVSASSSQSASDQLWHLMQRHPRGTALFAMSDELLVGAVQAAERIGCRIPEELAILAMSDGFAPEFYNPKITHILHSGYEVGLSAVHMLLDLIRGIKKTPGHLQLQCELVEMESV
jgi:LacI family transcriptional regulator